MKKAKNSSLRGLDFLPPSERPDSLEGTPPSLTADRGLVASPALRNVCLSVWHREVEESPWLPAQSGLQGRLGRLGDRVCVRAQGHG